MSTHTKRELREQRRSARREAERAEAAHAARRRRVLRLGAVAGAAVLAVVAAVAISSSSGETPAPAATASSPLFAGIPERNGVLGDPDAPLTLTEYVDLQCPVCATASSQTLPTLIDDYVRTGKVKLETRTLSFLGPDSVRAAQVAAGAERQGRLWPFLEAFYSAQGTENSGYVTEDFLREVSGAAGVDADAALEQADSEFAARRLERADADAARLGIDGTPTFTVARGDGAQRVLAADALDPASMAAALDRELER
jgi:protein-disulfide isomerase